MALFLIVSSFLTILILLLLSVNGFLLHLESVNLARHVYCALPVVIFSMFSHTMTIFYFIGTGKQVKEIVRERSLPPDLLEETRRLKREVFPAATCAIVAVMATFIIGGGVHVGMIPWYLHMILALLAVTASAWAFVREARNIYRNVLLAERVETLAGFRKP